MRKSNGKSAGEPVECRMPKGPQEALGQGGPVGLQEWDGTGERWEAEA